MQLKEAAGPLTFYTKLLYYQAADDQWMWASVYRTDIDGTERRGKNKYCMSGEEMYTLRCMELSIKYTGTH